MLGCLLTTAAMALDGATSSTRAHSMAKRGSTENHRSLSEDLWTKHSAAIASIPDAPNSGSFNVKCYDKLTDGSSTGTWHERCKYHGPHVLLLELANNKVLGAYLGAPLSDTPTIDDFGNQVGHTENNAWLSSSSAFLFSLPPEGVYGDAIKLPVGNPAKAFYESPNNGARFASLRCAAMHGCAVCVCERV